VRVSVTESPGEVKAGRADLAENPSGAVYRKLAYGLLPIACGWYFVLLAICDMPYAICYLPSAICQRVD